jgi:putative tryptophan/tyrosine transport system substrate-binding protein
MRRRDFIAGLGSAAVSPLVARAQQSGRVRIGIMFTALPPDDPEVPTRLTAFVQKLQELGWTDGRNMRIDYRSALGDAERLRKYATELVKLAPDVLLAGGSGALAAFQQATSTIPIVFANALDPVGFGNVASLARPGGNATGFMSAEFGLAGKLLELLKQIAPDVKRVVVLRSPVANLGELGAIQAVAPSFGVELTPVGTRDANEIERGITAFVRGPTDGLIDLSRAEPQTGRDLIIALAARYRLPAIYPFRRYVADGGLMSFGNDPAEPYRLAAGYVDRILRGAKPGDLPVQAPTKYELVVNLKTAKALGLTIPPNLLALADEVIE